MLLLSFGLTGLSGIFFKGTIQSFVIIAALYIVVRGVIWDPMRTLLRVKAVDTNSKKTAAAHAYTFKRRKVHCEHNHASDRIGCNEYCGA